MKKILICFVAGICLCSCEEKNTYTIVFHNGKEINVVSNNFCNSSDNMVSFYDYGFMGGPTIARFNKDSINYITIKH